MLDLANLYNSYGLGRCIINGLNVTLRRRIAYLPHLHRHQQGHADQAWVKEQCVKSPLPSREKEKETCLASLDQVGLLGRDPRRLLQTLPDPLLGYFDVNTKEKSRLKQQITRDKLFFPPRSPKPLPSPRPLPRPRPDTTIYQNINYSNSLKLHIMLYP